jgi:hypothetical protein
MSFDFHRIGENNLDKGNHLKGYLNHKIGWFLQVHWPLLCSYIRLMYPFKNLLLTNKSVGKMCFLWCLLFDKMIIFGGGEGSNFIHTKDESLKLKRITHCFFLWKHWDHYPRPFRGIQGHAFNGKNFWFFNQGLITFIFKVRDHSRIGN